MNQILRCDWPPEQVRWSFLARSGLPAVSCKKNSSESHIINPLLTKLVRSRWLDVGFVLFFVSLWTSTPSRSINTHTKKKLGQYPAILTLHLVNNPYIPLVETGDCFTERRFCDPSGCTEGCVSRMPRSVQHEYEQPRFSVVSLRWF